MLCRQIPQRCLQCRGKESFGPYESGEAKRSGWHQQVVSQNCNNRFAHPKTKKNLTQTQNIYKCSLNTYKCLPKPYKCELLSNTVKQMNKTQPYVSQAPPGHINILHFTITHTYIHKQYIGLNVPPQNFKTLKDQKYK